MVLQMIWLFVPLLSLASLKSEVAFDVSTSSFLGL
jgi:hypothetical protein